MILTDQEVKDILENIVELALALGWESIISQTTDGNLVGMYIGPEEWLKGKTGEKPGEIKH